MVFEERIEPPLGGVWARCHLVERAPVVRDQIASAEPLEEHEGIVARQVASAKARSPPGGVANRQQRNIDPAANGQLVRAGVKSRVAGEEHARFARAQ